LNSDGSVLLDGGYDYWNYFNYSWHTTVLISLQQDERIIGMKSNKTAIFNLRFELVKLIMPAIFSFKLFIANKLEMSDYNLPTLIVNYNLRNQFCSWQPLTSASYDRMRFKQDGLLALLSGCFIIRWII
jgi:hypothetical protein